MNYFILGEVLGGCDDGCEDGAPFEGLMIGDVFFEIASFAILGDEVAVIGGVVDIDELDKVGVLELLDDMNFVVEE